MTDVKTLENNLRMRIKACKELKYDLSVRKARIEKNLLKLKFYKLARNNESVYADREIARLDKEWGTLNKHWTSAYYEMTYLSRAFSRVREVRKGNSKKDISDILFHFLTQNGLSMYD